MILSTAKSYDISSAIESLRPGFIATVWFNDNGVATIQADGEIDFTENELDSAGETQELISKKKAKLDEINAARDKILAKPYKWPAPIQGKLREFTPDLLNQLNNAVMMDDQETTPWICVDNDAGENGRPVPTLTKAQLISICKHIKARRDLWIVEARRQKNEVLALTTPEAVDAYVVDIPAPEDI